MRSEFAKESLAGRLHELRRARGLSQTDLAGDGLSASYVSLLEAGKRVPSRAVVEQLAARLDCSPDYLETGIEPVERERAELEVRYAELAVRNGEAPEAAESFRRVISLAPADEALLRRARWGLAGALETTGDLEAAVTILEALRTEAEVNPFDHPWLDVVVALCRCYREAGDLARSVEIGEAALARANALGLEGSEQHAVLASSLIGVYYERGDLLRATVLVRDLMDKIRPETSHRARGAVYWNASLVAESRGELGEALALADRALAMFADGDDGRSVARLRTAYAWLLLRQAPPAAHEARQLLLSAQATLVETGSQIDLAYVDTELANVELVLGHPQVSLQHAQQSLARLGDMPRIEAAHALMSVGRARLALGEQEQASVDIRAAAETLDRLGFSRQAASAWREVADLLILVGDGAGSAEAYRRALDAVGLVASVMMSPKVPGMAAEVGRSTTP